jgi:hypothetical protein
LIPVTYSTYISNLIVSVLGRTIGTKQTYDTSQYITTITLIESISSFAAFGEVVLKPNTYTENMSYDFYIYFTKFLTLLPQWYMTVTYDLVLYLQDSIGISVSGITSGYTSNANNEAVSDALQMILAVANVKQNFTNFSQVLEPYNYTQFQINASVLYAATESSSSYILTFLRNGEAANMNTAIQQIAIFIVIGVFFFLIGILSQLVNAKTITGPWERLNRLQNATIKKFVPTGFLRMLGCKQITDLTLGTYVQKQLVILVVDIKDFDLIQSGSDPSVALELLNVALHDICPVVCKFNGFVSRYNCNGFSALFLNKKDAFEASIEIYNRSLTFHQRYIERKFPKISTISSIHCDNVFVGTIGEDQRMDCVIFGKASSVTVDLVRLNEKLKTSIIISESALPPESQGIRHLLTNEKCGPCYEVYDVSQYGVRTATVEIFEAGTREFTKKNYYVARKYFSQVVGMDPSDHVAQSFLDMCTKIISESEYHLNMLDSIDILMDEQLREPLEQFCIKDRSIENIYLWKKLEFEYKKTQPPLERKKLAKEIVDEFVNLKGVFAVRISDSSRNFFIRCTNDEDFIPPRNFFKELQTEVRLNISGSIDRFKETDECKAAFMAKQTSEMNT